LRIRTDFVTRPPRLTSADLARFWAEHAGEAVPFAGARDLAEMKKTSREKDYAAIGELARLMPDTRARILQSRSARDLLKLAAGHRALFRRLSARRPALAAAVRGLTALEAALDRERRELIHADEKRLARYAAAAAPWAAAWPKIEREMVGRPLREAHAIMVERAAGILPLRVPEETP
jgi:TorA maturation chaperone TorD